MIFEIRNYLIETFLTKYDDEVDSNNADDGKIQENAEDFEGYLNENDTGIDDDYDDKKITGSMETYLYVATNVDFYFKCWTFEMPFLEATQKLKHSQYL